MYLLSHGSTLLFQLLRGGTVRVIQEHYFVHVTCLDYLFQVKMLTQLKVSLFLHPFTQKVSL